MRPVYGNPVRTYYGKLTLFEAARKLKTVTVRTDLDFGRMKGFWTQSPILEVHTERGEMTPEVAALTEVTKRDIANPVPVLFDLIVQSIEDAWVPDAFHLVFHSSGWDSRIISAAIKKLVKKNGTDWLGSGLFFLCNRWEEKNFTKIMRAMEWTPDQYAVYADGEADEHFAVPVYDVWRCAPIPRPGNFFWYLSEWAENKGLIPSENVQAFTGLWANEAWFCFFPTDNAAWPRRVRKKYGWHMIASQPIKAQWVEHPLVSLPVLDVLSRAQPVCRTGNILREEVSTLACPEASGIGRQKVSDGSHTISERLRLELDAHYKTTEFGKRVEWQVPEHSGNSTDWGKWSMALLVQKLISEGVQCEWA